MMPTTPAQVYISHSHDDDALCAPLLDLLDAWNVDYWYDRQRGGGRELSTRAQRALHDCSVLLRICTPAANHSYPMSLEAGAFLSMQAEDHRAGQGARHWLVNLILDVGYHREPFDSAAPLLDATDPTNVGWVTELRRAVFLPPLSDAEAAEAAAVATRMVPKRGGLSRRRALALGATGVLVVAAGASGGVILLSHTRGTVTTTSTPRPTPPSTDSKLKWYKRVVAPTTQVSDAKGVGVAAALAGGTLFTGALDGSLYAVDASTGAERWHKTVGDGFYTAPVVGDGALFVCSRGADGVYRLDPTTGQQVWQHAESVHSFTNLAFANGRLYVSGIGDLGPLIAIADPSNGEQIGSKDLPTFGSIPLPTSQMAIAGNVVYVCSTEGYLYALDLRTTGTLALWRADVGVSAGLRLKEAPFIVSGQPTVAGGVVYVGSEDQSVYGFDAATGAKRWSFATTGQIVRSSPAVVEGTLYIGSDDTKLYALDAATGATRWVYTTAGKVRSSPVVAPDIVYVGSGDANVHAIHIETGMLVRKYATADSVIAPPLVADGTLYATDLAGYLYAFNLT
jgi:outer membrane protein assembly factor BamB